MSHEPNSSTTSALTWAGVRSARASAPEHVVSRSFAQETVILNIESGHYHGLDDTGGRFFEVMNASESLDAACEVLAAEYDQPLERIQEDLVIFVGELRALGLVELVDSTP